MNKKKLKMIFIFLALSGFLFLHFYAPRFVTEINNPVIALIRSRLPKRTVTFKKEGSKGKYIEFETKDKLILKGYLTYSNLDSTKATIILLHGIRSGKETFLSSTKKLADLGFNTIALDLRSHGESQGKHCTFGIKEKEDISALIDYLATSEKIQNNIGVWGQSLGAAVAIQSMATDKRIKFGIIESTFSDFKAITHDYFNYHLGFNIPFFTNYLVDRAGKIADFDPNDARPKKYCQKIEKEAVLVVHGNQDRRINIKYGRENFANIKSKNKEFLQIDGATHLNVREVGGEDYFNHVCSFIEKNISK